MKNNLSREDWKKWRDETVIYCVVPGVVAALTSLQVGDTKGAFVAFYTVFLAALINLLRKHAAGVELTDNTTVGDIKGSK